MHFISYSACCIPNINDTNTESAGYDTNLHSTPPESATWRCNARVTRRGECIVLPAKMSCCFLIDSGGLRPATLWSDTIHIGQVKWGSSSCDIGHFAGKRAFPPNYLYKWFDFCYGFDVRVDFISIESCAQHGCKTLALSCHCGVSRSGHDSRVSTRPSLLRECSNSPRQMISAPQRGEAVPNSSGVGDIL